MRVKTAPCAISQLHFNTKYGHYKMVQNYDIIELTIAIITHGTVIGNAAQSAAKIEIECFRTSKRI